MVQLLPFHTSARAGKLLPVRDSPTASHVVADVQETPLSLLMTAPLTSWVLLTVQLLPFHASASVSVAPPLSNRPTASQDDDDAHQMPGSCPAPGSGMLTIVQVLPLRLSERRLLSTFPTAMQVAVPVQDTPDRPQVGFVPDGVGVFCCCQLAEAGCATTRTADTTSAAVIASRFIAIDTPPEFRVGTVPWARCHAGHAWQGSPARTPQHGEVTGVPARAQ